MSIKLLVYVYDRRKYMCVVGGASMFEVRSRIIGACRMLGGVGTELNSVHGYLTGEEWQRKIEGICECT